MFGNSFRVCPAPSLSLFRFFKSGREGSLAGFEFWGRCLIGWGACDREVHNVMDADVYLFYFFIFICIRICIDFVFGYLAFGGTF